MKATVSMIDWPRLGGAGSVVPKCRQPKPAKQGTIYFIGPAEGMVKIGFTTDVATRLKRLQCGSPVPLYILARVDGPSTMEREYHRRFEFARAHGGVVHADDRRGRRNRAA
jgi:hypothetical protein